MLSKKNVIVREEAFRYFFYFMEERMNIFWEKYYSPQNLLTKDKVFIKHKFTNVYRASDRVSQYLINNVIYNKNYIDNSAEDILLRILIFKVFNKIETWEFLTSKIGEVSVKNFDPEKISSLLSERIKSTPIFNSAYLMTGSHKDFSNIISKHARWLKMIEKYFIKDKLFLKISNSKSLEDIYLYLTSCPFIGDFLGYQYTIDFNYSEVINFDEDSFVKAGIGAVRGLKKCFLNYNDFSREYLIEYTLDNSEKYREKYGFNNFRNLFGREPKLIDIQNCFCETDKYLRAVMPDLKIDNVRIKQKYKRSNNNIAFFFPPKWGINDKLNRECIQQNLQGLTLF